MRRLELAMSTTRLDVPVAQLRARLRVVEQLLGPGLGELRMVWTMLLAGLGPKPLEPESGAALSERGSGPCLPTGRPERPEVGLRSQR